MDGNARQERIRDMNGNARRRLEAVKRQENLIPKMTGMAKENPGDYALHTLQAKAFCENAVGALVLAGVPMERIVNAIMQAVLTGDVNE